MSKRSPARRADGARRAELVLLYGVMPLWGLAGLADWYCHRRTAIEQPGHGGVAESAIHSVMLAEAALPISLVLLAEPNLLVAAISLSAAVLHEVTAHRDLEVAGSSSRPVNAGELQVHSVLEVLPFVLVVLVGLTLSPLRGRAFGDRASWRLERRREPLPAYVRALGAAWIVLSGFLPYGEELLRCARAGRVAAGEGRR